jgi:hypothetical protein
MKPIADPHYDRGYHGVHHRLLIEDDEYFWARAEAVLSYFAPADREHRIFEFGCGIGQNIEEPLEALRTMRELLRPGGSLHLIVPKEGHWGSAFTGDINQHLYCWNFNTINNLLLRAGHEPYLNTYRYPFGWHALLPIRRWLGRLAYLTISRLGSVFRRNGELVVQARRASA